MIIKNPLQDRMLKTEKAFTFRRLVQHLDPKFSKLERSRAETNPCVPCWPVSFHLVLNIGFSSVTLGTNGSGSPSLLEGF